MGDKDLDGIPDHLDTDLDPDDLTGNNTFQHTFEPHSLTARPNDPMTFQAPMTAFRDPRFVQDHAGKNFSKGGQQYFEKATGTKYTTTRQLAEAIQKGLVDPSIVKVGTVNHNGTTYILDSRSYSTLKRAGIRDEDINFVDLTLDKLRFQQFLKRLEDPRNNGPEGYQELLSRCFLTGTMIDMWPVEAGLKPDADGLYDEEDVRAKVWRKPVEEVTAKDWVLSFDQDGNLKPGRVKQTFENEAKIILDFHGTFVTPAHVYYCAGGTYEGKFVPLIDILRDDGVVQHADGSLIRASTGCEVGSEDDKLFWAFLLYEDENGMECVREKRQLRLGARWMMPNGKHFSMREYMEGCGIELVESGELEGYVRFKKTGLTTVFAWTLSGTLPSPEDFVLRRSQTTLEDIYRASEWESVHPQMPAPVIMDSGPVQPLSVQQFDDMPRNNPIGFQNNSPSSELKLNRKARKAEAARQRKTKKARQKADKAMGTLH